MRNYIYKVIIATIAVIIVFEFTIGRKFNEFNQITEKFLTKEGRKGTGEFRGNRPWDITDYDIDGKFIGKWGNGKKQ